MSVKDQVVLLIFMVYAGIVFSSFCRDFKKGFSQMLMQDMTVKMFVVYLIILMMVYSILAMFGLAMYLKGW